jgi:hypothetical protein
LVVAELVVLAVVAVVVLEFSTNEGDKLHSFCARISRMGG